MSKIHFKMPFRVPVSHGLIKSTLSTQPEHFALHQNTKVLWKEKTICYHSRLSNSSQLQEVNTQEKSQTTKTLESL